MYKDFCCAKLNLVTPSTDCSLSKSVQVNLQLGLLGKDVSQCLPAFLSQAVTDNVLLPSFLRKVPCVCVPSKGN